MSSSPHPTSRAEFRVVGLDCAEEVSLISRRLDGFPGLRSLAFDVIAGRMTAEFDPASTDPESIAAAVAETGLECFPWRDEPPPPDSWPRRHGRDLLCAASGLALAGGLALRAVHSGDWLSVLAHDAAEGPGSRLELALFVAGIVAGAVHVAPKGLRALASLRPEMNALVLVSLAGAGVLGEWAEGAALAFLFALAGRLEAWSMGRARRELGGLVAASPSQASVVHGDHEHAVPVERVAVGAIVRVRPGHHVPCDGEVVAGSSGVNEAMLTGESVPVRKRPGDTVYAGSFNGDGALDIRTTRAVADTRLARILRMVEESRRHRAPSERFVDRFARYYTPAMFGVAALVAVGPPLLAGGVWGEWFYRAMLVLLISCPCALVISTPVAIAAAVASAAHRGVLIKGGAYLEEAARLRAVAFDKTGVLTRGEPVVEVVEPLDGHSEGEALRHLAGLERYSEHPLARSIVEHAVARGIAPPPATEFHACPGLGATAEVEGQGFWVGNLRMADDRAAPASEFRARVAEMQDARHTVVVCGSDREPWALVGLSDPPRPDAAQAIAELRELGIERLVLLTGDNRRTADAVARAAGIDEVRAELLPEDKTAAVRELAASAGRVAMVGDGVNDAAAIAAATLGIGMGGRGSDVALETADIVLMSPKLLLLPGLVRHARRALAVIQQNVALALVFKLVFLVLAAMDRATLWMAVVADMGATLLVIFNGLRMLDGRAFDSRAVPPASEIRPPAYR